MWPKAACHALYIQAGCSCTKNCTWCDPCRSPHTYIKSNINTPNETEIMTCDGRGHKDNINWPYICCFLVEWDFWLLDLLHDDVKLWREGQCKEKEDTIIRKTTLKTITLLDFLWMQMPQKEVPFFSVLSAALWTAPFSSPPPWACRQSECACSLCFQFLKNNTNTLN